METAEAITSISIVLGFLSAFVVSILYYLRAKHQEKMSMIEKGYQPPIQQAKKKNNSSASLKWGIFIISLAVGLFLGYILESQTTIEGVIAYFSMILLFGGSGLVLNHYLEQKNNAERVNG
ncbi:MAG: hypothetical protein JW801_03160 [Bacteroidales bacterium]|nr:hypothetical protein [Bacteroidales bacterium]